MRNDEKVSTALSLFSRQYQILPGSALYSGVYHFNLATDNPSSRLIHSIDSPELAAEIFARHPSEEVAVVVGDRMIPVSLKQIEENRRLAFRIGNLIRRQLENCPELGQWWLRAINLTLSPPLSELDLQLVIRRVWPPSGGIEG